LASETYAFLKLENHHRSLATRPPGLEIILEKLEFDDKYKEGYT
jgi:hypothetical protein